MQTNQPLTEEQVLEYLRERYRNELPAPALNEIARQAGHKTTASVRRILDRLEERGLIQREPGKRRHIQLTDRALPPRGLPVLGQIAAGQPQEAIEAEEHFELGDTYDARHHFGLRVRGDSMIDAHIMDGDIVIIRRQVTCQNGDIVAAVLDGEATLKRFFRRSDHVLLKPENPTLKPIRTSSVEIRGVMVGLIRRFR